MVPLKTATVSIGIPVYNGEQYLEETLQSLLTQSFQDFEIVISDNASTDSTEKICLTYAERDDRIRYYRSDSNKGPGWNYNRVLDLAKGQYFKWQAHDDLLAPDFLEKCVRVLDQQPDIVLCHCYSNQIDNHDQVITSNSIRLKTDAPHYSTRLRSLLLQGRNYVGCEIFGLMRMNVLQKAPRQAAYAHGDFLFLCHLAFYGRFYQIPEFLFSYRIHAAQSMQEIPAHLAKKSRRLLPFTGPMPSTGWWDPRKKGKVDFPTWRFYGVQMQFIAQHPLPVAEKNRCYQAVMERLFLEKDILRLGIDCLLALETALLGVSGMLMKTTRSRGSRSHPQRVPS